MNLTARLAAAFVASLVAAGGLQQILMAGLGLHDTLAALAPLAVLIAVVAIAFGATVWRRMSAALTGAVLLGVIAVVAAAGIVIGLANRSPEVGGNIFYSLAVLIDLCFLLPSALAVLINWAVLRSGGVAAKGS